MTARAIRGLFWLVLSESPGHSFIHCKLKDAELLYGCRRRLSNKTREIIINDQSTFFRELDLQDAEPTALCVRESGARPLMVPFQPPAASEWE